MKRLKHYKWLQTAEQGPKNDLTYYDLCTKIFVSIRAREIALSHLRRQIFVNSDRISYRSSTLN